jgi:hypothetical protein
MVTHLRKRLGRWLCGMAAGGGFAGRRLRGTAAGGGFAGRRQAAASRYGGRRWLCGTAAGGGFAGRQALVVFSIWFAVFSRRVDRKRQILASRDSEDIYGGVQSENLI